MNILVGAVYFVIALILYKWLERTTAWSKFGRLVVALVLAFVVTAVLGGIVYAATN